MEALKLKHGTHMESGLLYRVYQNQDRESITLGVASFDRFYKFPLIKKIVALFSGTVKVRKLKLGTHMEMGLMYHVYRNKGKGPYLMELYPLIGFMLPCYHVLQ